jgi:PHD/YefM family antitoxin component YafN of YafNO toxin-antitoxin module
MEEVNALKLRNNLGEILDRLRDKGEPILVSKGKELRAVLVTPEQFEKRFLDWQVEAQRKRFLNNVASLKKKKKSGLESLTILRQMRGYDL